ncbi:hypothetical protein K4A83_20425 [Spirulina subsalsa FACHB-351]|uniref:Uncharacterized protein n=1 Tax=Spirulina subsalsa FACHB-351 TaxID=234711 RepID=A0ABT3LC02_9CYAN|nr:hypothetical protein [Spirulina subsalsa]MCW6038619.1 hypothetical protein [Spirulina subsalsa FACHB-351]
MDIPPFASCPLIQSFWQRLKPGTWIMLEDLPSSFAGNQALLLCQISEQEWLTWVPNHGEYYLVF